MPVSYTLDDLKKTKEVSGSDIPSDAPKNLLEGESAEAYLAGYAAGAAGVPLPEEPTVSSGKVVAGGTVEPLRIKVPWWP